MNGGAAGAPEVAVVRKTAPVVIVLTVSSIFLAPARAAEDWPQWLGPRGNGVSGEKLSVDQWPKSGPKALWSKQVGVGHSSPVAVDGCVFLFHLVGNQYHLTCFDADTGKVIWDQTYNGGWTGNYKGTRATPVIEKS